MADFGGTGNLPLSLTTFIGRHAEMREVIVRMGRSRLVTITGVGGSGKSRLALEVATSIQEQFRDGVCLVELSAMSGPAALTDVVTTVVRPTSMLGPPSPELLVALLAPCELLLVLDNCEDVISAVASFAERLLSAVADLHILTTSRESLSITGETLWRVQGLRVPSQALHDAPSLNEIDSVQLFCDRATAIDPSFALSSQNADAVGTICRRLDGLPLAIELAGRPGGRARVDAVSAGIQSPLEVEHGNIRAALDFLLEAGPGGPPKLCAARLLPSGISTATTAKVVDGSRVR